VAAFHVRDIPPELLEKLRGRAQRQGRSMNAEILAILERELDRPSPEEWFRDWDRLSERYAGRTWDPPPEVLIREGRDSR
jgi:plasmid stability protein